MGVQLNLKICSLIISAFSAEYAAEKVWLQHC
jgi:hypothetical protein